MSQEEGKLQTNSRGPGPPIGVRDLPASVRTSHVRRTNIPPSRGPGAPRVPQARRRRESSTGRLAHPPHSMRVVEVCSAAAARGAAFVRPHCRPHITEVHSADRMRRIRADPVCRIKWIRRHDTLSSYCLRRKLHSPFSYAAGYDKLRRKLRSGAVSTRQGMTMPDGRFPRAKQGNPGIRSPSPATP